MVTHISRMGGRDSRMSLESLTSPAPAAQTSSYQFGVQAAVPKIEPQHPVDVVLLTPQDPLRPPVAIDDHLCRPTIHKPRLPCLAEAVSCAYDIVYGRPSHSLIDSVRLPSSWTIQSAATKGPATVFANAACGTRQLDHSGLTPAAVYRRAHKRPPKIRTAGAKRIKRYKMCEDCKEILPSYGFRSDGKVRWCAGCAKAGHIGAEYLNKRQMCADCGKKRATYGLPDRSGVLWCPPCAKSGRHPDAVPKQKLKMCVDCGVKHANYGLPADGKRRWCGSCARNGQHLGAHRV